MATKISVITWDGGFRECFHTVECFASQSMPSSEYEFLWCESGSAAAEALQEKIDAIENSRIVYANNPGEYHVGLCMNAGMSASTGELLVLIDGDIVVDEAFLERIWSAHAGLGECAIYVRRWDQPEADQQDVISIDQLERVCRLGNPTNYGGCLIARRETIDRVGGYETHPIIGGPGAVSMELYVRLRNLGVPIVWHPTEKVFHPWHPGTKPSTDTLQQRMQKWVIDRRAKNLDTVANARQVDEYLKHFEDAWRGSTFTKGKNVLSKIFGTQWAARLLRKGRVHAAE